MQSVCYGSLGSSVSMIASNPHSIKSICYKLPRAKCQFLLFPEHLDSRENLACYYRDGQTPYWFLFCLPLGCKILYSKNLDEGFGWVSSAESAHLTPDWVAGGRWVPRGLWHSVRTAELPGQLYLDLSFRLNFFSHYTAV